MATTITAQFAPLAQFYANNGAPMPMLTTVLGPDMPEPYRALLVNQGDMTPTLERFHHSKLHLRVLGSSRHRDEYRRQVVLLSEGERPVEFGAICIHLEALPPTVRQQVLAGKRPLGGVLLDNQVVHSSQPSGFFSVTGDAIINQALGLARPCTLYGRCNNLVGANGRAIADVVEVLPPASTGGKA